MYVCAPRTFASLTNTGSGGQLDGFGGFMMILLQFVYISLTSVGLGVGIGLAASAVGSRVGVV